MQHMDKIAISLPQGTLEAIAARRAAKVAAQVRGKFGKDLPQIQSHWAAFAKSHGIHDLPHSGNGMPFVSRRQMENMHTYLGTPAESRPSVAAIAKMHEYDEGAYDLKSKSRAMAKRGGKLFAGHGYPSVVMRESNLVQRAADPGTQFTFAKLRHDGGESAWLKRVVGKEYGSHFTNEDIRGADAIWKSIGRKFSKLKSSGDRDAANRLRRYSAP